MSEATYAAMREFIKVTTELEVQKATQPFRDEIRSLKAELETRSAPELLVGPPGPAGKDGEPGKDGAPGERGADGLASQDEIRSIVKEEITTLEVRSFVDIYREVYQPGELYKRGDIVTWDGSLHLAQKDTTEKPGASKDWKLIVKRGRDR